MELCMENHRAISISITLYDALKSLLYNILVFKDNERILIPLHEYIKKYKTLPRSRHIIYSAMLLYMPPEFLKNLEHVIILWSKNKINYKDYEIKLNFEDDLIYLLAKYIFFKETNKSLLEAFPELVLYDINELKNMIIDMALL